MLKKSRVLCCLVVSCVVVLCLTCMRNYQIQGHQPRIFCAIPTTRRSLDRGGAAVRDTWATGCDGYRIFTPPAPISHGVEHGTDDVKDVVHLEGDRDDVVHLEGDRDDVRYLTEKTFLMFLYLYRNHLNEADWFLKADHDTYIIVNNLRHLVSEIDHNSPYYIGRHFPVLVVNSEPHVDEGEMYGYMSGGAGYVISQEALRRLGPALEASQPDAECVPRVGSAEDVSMARCLQSVHVKILDSRDQLGRQTFHPFNLATHIFTQFPDWYGEHDKESFAENGINCCSLYSISYHYVEPDMMRIMHHLLHNTDIYNHVVTY